MTVFAASGSNRDRIPFQVFLYQISRPSAAIAASMTRLKRMKLAPNEPLPSPWSGSGLRVLILDRQNLQAVTGAFGPSSLL